MTVLLTDVRATAALLIAKGWQIVRLQPQSKKCVDADWLTREYVAQDYAPGDNTGIKSVGGLVDVDCDCLEAIFIADVFTHKTKAVYGRKSRPRSQRLYGCPDITAPSAFEDLVEKEARKKNNGEQVVGSVSLIEIRVNHQSMAPFSEHPAGETVEWDDPAFLSSPDRELKVDKPLLIRAVQLTATGAMICRYYNPPGARHDWGMALAGLLRRQGITEAEATRLMTRAAEWARDQHVKDRLDAIRNTYARSDDAPTTGAKNLIEQTGTNGKDFVATLNQIWHVGSEPRGILANRVDPATVDLVWERLVEHNEPATLFRRQRKIVMPVAEEVTSNFPQLFSRQLKLQLRQENREREGTQFAEVDLDLFTELLARSVKFVKEIGRGDEKRYVPAYPDVRLMKQVAASPVCPLPLRRGIAVRATSRRSLHKARGCPSERTAGIC